MDQQKLTSYPKEKINILLLENISDAAAAEFTSAGYANVKRLSGALNEEDLIREVKDVHLLGIRSKTHVQKSAGSCQQATGYRVFLYRHQPGRSEKRHGTWCDRI